jgi:hypothetical protein
MKIKSFDSLQTLSERFDSEVFRDISDGSLYVFDKMSNSWHCYRWTSGQREIMYVNQLEGELPIVTQVYPEF